MRSASVPVSLCVDAGSDVPEFSACALELGVEERVLESDRVAVAPSLEGTGVAEGDRLDGAQSASWDVFAFDIEASCYALKMKPDRPCAPLRAYCAALKRVGT
jgi:hypothetical protein